MALLEVDSSKLGSSGLVASNVPVSLLNTGTKESSREQRVDLEGHGRVI